MRSADERTVSDALTDPGPAPAPSPAPAPVRRRSGISMLLGIAILLAVALTLWSWMALAWSYSEGERAGIVQRFAIRGWICKTHEGELAQYIVPGVAPHIWEFSVRNRAVAEQISRYVGQPVQLHYSEHRGLPTSCFGDTRFFVDGVTPMSATNSPFAPPGTQAATPTPTPAPAPKP